MKRIKISLVVVGFVLILTAVGCTAIRTYDDGYEGEMYSNRPFYGAIDPFTGFYYNSAPYGYYSQPYANRYDSRGYGYGYNSPRRHDVNRQYREGRNYRQYPVYQNNQPSQEGRNYNRGNNYPSEQGTRTEPQNRNESRSRVFGSPKR
ncbi:MAG: hypothetical protein NVS9B7_15530 [Flavisolibacter sp.]